MPIGLPLTVYALFFLCTNADGEGSCNPLDFKASLARIPPPAEWFSVEATKVSTTSTPTSVCRCADPNSFSTGGGRRRPRL
jgi:hypothetical protein